jgi:hypothetical protein
MPQLVVIVSRLSGSLLSFSNRVSLRTLYGGEHRALTDATLSFRELDS